MDPTKAAVAVVVAVALAGCAAPGARSAAPPPTAPASTVEATTASTSTTSRPPAVGTTPSTTRPGVESATARCPGNLASGLASTGSARQLVTVEAAGWDTSYATVELWQRTGSCWLPAGGPWSGRIGENGFSDHHTEGDDTTPTGVYGVGPVMYGNAPDPGVQEPYHRLVCGDWWDEDASSAEYNTFQHVACGTRPPFGGGSEALWTETAAYPSFAVIDYNTGPIVKGAGSAIFLHADTGSATVGCVSIPLADLDQTLRWMEPADGPVFVMGPAAEIARF